MAGQPGASQARSSLLRNILDDINITVGIGTNPNPKPEPQSPNNPPQPVLAPVKNWFQSLIAGGTADGVGIYLLVGLIIVALVVGGSIYSHKR